MKKKWGIIGGGSGVLFGMGLSRWTRSNYGINGSLVIAVVGLIIIIVGFVITAYISKKYLETVMSFLPFSTLIVSIVGIYLQNIYMIIGGLILFAVLGEFMVRKVFPKFKDRK